MGHTPCFMGFKEMVIMAPACGLIEPELDSVCPELEKNALAAYLACRSPCWFTLGEWRPAFSKQFFGYLLAELTKFR